MTHLFQIRSKNVEALQIIYINCLEENEKKILFWEKHLQNLEALDFNTYSDKLTVPILVPIGNRVLFRGELKHTNEVTVAMGADYFVKCSVHQAQILQQHRIKIAKSKLEMFKTEKKFLQNYLEIVKNTTYDHGGYEIIEMVSEKEDKRWREQHRENVRQYKQRKGRDDEALGNVMTEDELWDRLDHLEMQEEWRNELYIDPKAKFKAARAAKQDGKTDSDDDDDHDDGDDDYDDDGDDDNNMGFPYNYMCDAKVVDAAYLEKFRNRRKVFVQPSKLQLFELVLERHNMLKETIAELRARQKAFKNQEEMAGRLDDMEKLEELEDEMAILEDMLASDTDDDDIEVPEEEDNPNNPPKKSVAFADEESETFELTFKHSEVEPSDAPYDPQNDITKPSDIYSAYPSNFNGETISILKKPKQAASTEKEEQKVEVKTVKTDSNLTNIIIVKDVVEKVDTKENNVIHNKRPMSLFKKSRQQLKE